MHRTMQISSISRSSNAQKSLAAGASPQILLGKLTALPQTPWMGLRGLLLMPLFLRGGDRWKRGRKGEGRQNDICLRAPETPAPPLFLEVSREENNACSLCMTCVLCCGVQGGSLLAMTLMLILRHDHVTLYIGTSLFGVFLSSITPTALSVAEMYLELSGWSSAL